MDEAYPELIQTEAELMDLLTRPRPQLVEFIQTLESPLVVLGAGGKMGPSLACLAQRAARQAQSGLEVVAVDRFSDEANRLWLEAQGVRTIRANLLEPGDLQRLPDTQNLIYMAGMKFGTLDNPALTWAINGLIPAFVCRRYPQARTVAFSTGNVYALAPVDSGGALESDPPGAIGEYANSCLARERVFEYYSQTLGTPVLIARLNYAVELRYGVLFDIAQKVFEGQPVDVTMGHFNCIWQGDANDMMIRALALAESPAAVLNVTSPRISSIREMALRFGELMGKQPRLVGAEAGTALISNARKAARLLGEPPTRFEHITRWIARWIEQGGVSLGKPTHYEVRDGAY